MNKLLQFPRHAMPPIADSNPLTNTTELHSC